MTHFFCSFFLFLVRIRHTFCRVVSLISSPSEEEEEGKTGAPLKSVSREKAASKSEPPAKVRAIVVVVVLRRRKEWSWSSSSKRGGKIIDFHSADSLREFQFKWPTTRRRRPNKSRRRLMVVRLRGLHKHPPRNKTKTLYYPWWRKSQRWTGPCTRPASCPFYSAFTSTLVPMMRSESRSLEFAFELVAVFLLFFL